jgi:hypothetical protein
MITFLLATEMNFSVSIFSTGKWLPGYENTRKFPYLQLA